MTPGEYVQTAGILIHFYFVRLFSHHLERYELASTTVTNY